MNSLKKNAYMFIFSSLFVLGGVGFHYVPQKIILCNLVSLVLKSGLVATLALNTYIIFHQKNEFFSIYFMVHFKTFIKFNFNNDLKRFQFCLPSIR